MTLIRLSELGIDDEVTIERQIRHGGEVSIGWDHDNQKSYHLGANLTITERITGTVGLVNTFNDTVTLCKLPPHGEECVFHAEEWTLVKHEKAPRFKEEDYPVGTTILLYLRGKYDSRYVHASSGWYFERYAGDAKPRSWEIVLREMMTAVLPAVGPPSWTHQVIR